MAVDVSIVKPLAPPLLEESSRISPIQRARALAASRDERNRAELFEELEHISFRWEPPSCGQKLTELRLRQLISRHLNYLDTFSA